jgi:hypothetical protein
VKSLFDIFKDLSQSGAKYDPFSNSFQVKPENMAVMQANDWAAKQHEDLMRFMDQKPRGFDDDL